MDIALKIDRIDGVHENDEGERKEEGEKRMRGMHKRRWLKSL